MDKTIENAETNKTFNDAELDKIFKDVDRNRLTNNLITAGAKGDADALGQLQKCFDPYIRKLATMRIRGTRYLNEDLYDFLKSRLLLLTITKFTLNRE